MGTRTNTTPLEFDLTKEISEIVRVELKFLEHKSEKERERVSTWFNVTPYMGGNFKGRTFEGRSFVAWPEAQAIKARARYVSLLALNSFLHKPGSFKDAYRISLRPRSKGGEKYPLLCLIYGCTKPVEMRALFKLAVVPKWKDVRRWKYAECYKKQIKHQNKRTKRPDRYNTLLKLKDKRCELAPAEVYDIEIELRRSFEENRLREILDKVSERVEEIGKIVTEIFDKSVFLALTLFGIGKGASRGFGRFWIRRDEIPCSEIEDALKGLMEAWKEVLNELEGHGVLDQDSVNFYRDSNNRITWTTELFNGNVPHLGHLVGKLCSTYLKRGRYDGVNDKIERIARAVLKSSWKRAVHYKGSGANFHTWPLGLPRNSNLNCTCGNRRGGKTAYGYLMALLEEGRDYFCEINSLCGGRNVLTSQPRRQSTIYLLPVKEGILAVPFFSYDLRELIFSPYWKLSHVGGKFVKMFNSPCCNRRFVSVEYLLYGGKLRPIRLTSATCGCDGLIGKIAMPRNNRLQYYFATNAIYEKVLIAAYNWVFSLL